MDAWMLTKHDRKLDEKRILGIYLRPQDAIADADAYQPDFVSVDPIVIFDGPQFGSVGSALEADSSDFDTPIHVTGEVR